jgi:hypothetical protein
MAESVIRDYAKAKSFHRQTLDRWIAWEPADQAALEKIALALKIGENHLRDMMDWLEETSLRDDAKIHEILTRPAIYSIETDPRLGRADKLKRIKEQLRRWRFPRLAAMEQLIRVKIQELKLPAEIHFNVPPGLEGGRLQVEFSAGSAAEFGKLTQGLNEAATAGLTAEIFDLLSGRTAENEPDQS